MRCPSCGKENPASEQYCLDCGSDLSAAPPPAGQSAAQPAGGQAAGGAAPQSLAMSDEEFQRLLHTPPAETKCPDCGAAAPQGGTFCDTCGEPLAAAPADQAAATGIAASVVGGASASPAGAAAASVPPVDAAAMPPTQPIPAPA